MKLVMRGNIKFGVINIKQEKGNTGGEFGQIGKITKTSKRLKVNLEKFSFVAVCAGLVNHPTIWRLKH